MDRRQKLRVETALPVRVWGVDAYSLPFAQLATVKNISTGGAVLQGMSRTMRRGEILEMQYGEEKVEVRVMWVGMPGTPTEGEVGVQHLPTEPLIWEVDVRQCVQLAGNG